MSFSSASLQGILARLPEYMCFGASVLDRLLEHLHTHPQCLTAQQVAWMHTSWCLYMVVRAHM